ncbi:hypothetical protein DM806_25495 [Sphingobium lactosutens]|uniref:hypothetical protein n=1 Tax=Sphingobium lactosutens TaxID=522773 RepID=UPI0015BE5785|nr:hypothetical protein [Sphingobium lactosutens]NWK98959.1 hypothetical protein [Sphingobium lactosutens]
MAYWHERLSARIGLRLAGLALLASVWPEDALLRTLVSANPAGEASPSQVLLAALLFMTASAGMALAVMGAGLWAPVTVSDRWAATVPLPVRRDPSVRVAA